MKDLIPMSWVKFNGYENEEWNSKMPFKKDVEYFYLGEVTGQPGHGVIRMQDGTIEVGWHTDMFEIVDYVAAVFELTADDLEEIE